MACMWGVVGGGGVWVEWQLDGGCDQQALKLCLPSFWSSGCFLSSRRVNQLAVNGMITQQRWPVTSKGKCLTCEEYTLDSAMHDAANTSLMLQLLLLGRQLRATRAKLAWQHQCDTVWTLRNMSFQG